LGQERKWLEHCGRGSTDKLANERCAKANRAATVGVGNQITLVCTPFISDALGGTSAREAAISD
jgi:hypothetical protein